MASPLDRAQFLRGDFSGKRIPQRPPWTVVENRFIELCSREGACVAACPERILEKGRGGFPTINFALGSCTFCGDCLKACPSGALHKHDDAPPWRLKALIQPECLAYGQVVCRTCGEHCPAGAIRFPPLLGAVARPQVDSLKCTGCGGCFAPCPNNAIRLVAE